MCGASSVSEARVLRAPRGMQQDSAQCAASYHQKQAAACAGAHHAGSTYTGGLGPWAPSGRQDGGVPAPRCDSSDCLFCQYSRDAPCSVHALSSLGTTDTRGSLLFSLPQPTHLSAPDNWHQPQPSYGPDSSRRPRSRRRQSSSEEDGSPRARQRATHEQPQQPASQGTSSQHSGLVEFSQLAQPSLPGSHDMVGSLDFSPDGRFLTTGSMAKEVKLYGLSGLFKAWHDGDCSSPCSYSPSRHRKCDRDPSEHSDSVTGDKEMSEGDSEGSRGRRRKCRSIRRGGVGHGAVGGMSVQISSVRRGKHVRCSADISYGSASNCVQPLAVHRLASKVSCLSWSPSHDGLVSVGDYDGVITQLHVCSGHQVSDVDAHGGRRIWGIAHSRLQERLCASVADDGTARLWTGFALDRCAAVIQPPSLASHSAGGGSQGGMHRSSSCGGRLSSGGASAALCGVDFSPVNPHLMALAGSDHTVYLYDLRSLHAPLHTLNYHRRPVSYVKFYGASQLISASTDATLAAWEVNAGADVPLRSVTHSHTHHTHSVSDPVHSHKHHNHHTALPSPHSYHHAGNSNGMATAGDSGWLEAGTWKSPLHSSHQQLFGLSTNGHPNHHSHTHTHHDTDMEGVEGDTSMIGGLGGYMGVSHTHTNQRVSIDRGSGGWRGPSAPSWLLRGHRNERSFVGLSVRPEDNLVACGSESRYVYTYFHDALPANNAALYADAPLYTYLPLTTQAGQGGGVLHTWPHSSGAGGAGGELVSAIGSVAPGQCSIPSASPLSVFDMGSGGCDGAHADPRMPSRSQPVTPHAAGAAAAAASRLSLASNAAAAPPVPRAPVAAPIVCSVAWQAASAGAALGLPPLLAAGTSTGSIKLLFMQA